MWSNSFSCFHIPIQIPEVAFLWYPVLHGHRKDPGTSWQYSVDVQLSSDSEHSSTSKIYKVKTINWFMSKLKIVDITRG